ncbi:hypothetical protein KW795_02420 [Candidatus Microgenomates bacterium]|nr:hypothetical protein [Candidatus Microgenomates bacterium]
MSDSNLENRPWWGYLENDLRELVQESLLLLDIFKERQKSNTDGDSFHDFSFIVFPIAKAYEGFLKKLFFDLDFITHDDYYGSRFRIGRALNPSLDEKYKDESVYEKLVRQSGDKSLADKLWITWKDSRNLVFHWFPDEKRAINLTEANVKIEQVLNAIDTAFKECKMNK